MNAKRFDLSTVKKCGAKTRRNTSCLAPAMTNGRCKFHGGKSTGPITTEGKNIIGQTKIKHGLYSKQNLQFNLDVKKILRNLQF